jgi:ribosomal protein L37AE/L43A
MVSMDSNGLGDSGFMSHCPHNVVEVLDEDWWFCPECKDAGAFIPRTRFALADGLPPASQGRRYCCPECGNVVTVWQKRTPERVPVHDRWSGSGGVLCAASCAKRFMEAAP